MKIPWNPRKNAPNPPDLCTSRTGGGGAVVVDVVVPVVVVLVKNLGKP